MSISVALKASGVDSEGALANLTGDVSKGKALGACALMVNN